VKPPISRAMILCAGLGTRLAPITDKFAKPLVPILNVPNVVHNIHLLKRAGIKEIVFNLHHLGKSIEQALGDGSQWDMKFQYSPETILLGTGGGVKHAEKLLANEPFILCNCDFVTDIDLLPIIDQHFSRNAMATMVLIEDKTRQPLFSEVGIDALGQLCSFPKLSTATPVRTGIFTGIHVLSPGALSFLKEEPSDIISSLYYPLMKDKPSEVFGHFADGFYWYDTGDLKGIWQTSMHLLHRLQNSPSGAIHSCLTEMGEFEQSLPGVWTISGITSLPFTNVTGPVVIGYRCSLSRESQIGPFAVVGNKAEIGEGTTLARAIVLPESKIIAQKVREAVCFGSQAFSIK
jgi:mannose-1-phosphate guanylyltransferase / phosphomannomutase